MTLLKIMGHGIVGVIDVDEHDLGIPEKSEIIFKRFIKKKHVDRFQINHLVSFLTSTSLTPNLIGYNICVRIAIPRESSESLICLSQNCGRNRQRKFLPRIR